MNLIKEIFLALQTISLLEIFAVFFSFTSTILLIYNHILVFPFTIIGSALYVWLFYQAGIYAEIFVSLYFIITSIIGWYHWNKGVFNAEPPEIEKAKSKDWLIAIILFLIFYAMLFYFLAYFTDSNIVVFDSLTTALAFVATILMVNRKIENWIIWIIALVIAIPLYSYKHLYLTSVFYIFTLILNLIGLKKWKNLYQIRNKNTELTALD